MIAQPVQFEAIHLCRLFHRGKPDEARAVDDISLSIALGEFTVLAGPSGSGKTTLLSMLGLLDRPTSGRLLFEERDVTRGSDVSLARLRRRLGFVFQDSALLPRLSLLENIGYPLIPRGVTRARRHALAMHWLARLGLERHAQKSPGDLSTGERQRVALARALASEPAALLADEPTANLDPRTAELVIGVFRERHAEGVTIVTATHDPALVKLATRVVSLDGGRVVADSLSGQVRSNRSASIPSPTGIASSTEESSRS